VLQDNPKTLNAGISHPKRGLPIVITRSGKDILNFTTVLISFLKQVKRSAANRPDAKPHVRGPLLSIHHGGKSACWCTVEVAFVEFSLEETLEKR